MNELKAVAAKRVDLLLLHHCTVSRADKGKRVGDRVVTHRRIPLKHHSHTSSSSTHSAAFSSTAKNTHTRSLGEVGGGGDARPARPEYATRRRGTTRFHFLSLSLAPTTRSNGAARYCCSLRYPVTGALAVIQRYSRAVHSLFFCRDRNRSQAAETNGTI